MCILPHACWKSTERALGWSYDTLLQVFSTLYQELDNAKRLDVSNIERQIFDFVANDIFKKSLPKQSILHSNNSCMCQYEKELLNFLNILLPMLTEGFSIQRGALFTFGPKANGSIGTLLKFSSGIATVKEKLNQSPTHSLNEERTVGFITHKVTIRGPDQSEPTF